MTFAETGHCSPGDPEFDVFMRQMHEHIEQERQEAKYRYPCWRNKHHRGADGKLEEESSILLAGPNDVAYVFRGYTSKDLWEPRWRAHIIGSSEIELEFFHSRWEAKRACEKVLSQWRAV